MNSFAMDQELLANIKSRLAELESLLGEMSSHWLYEDPIYRFYHQSFKVYNLQENTRRIVAALKSIAPEGTAFCREFEEIYHSRASGKKFEMEHNRNWSSHTRVFVEAFFHARFFLDMAVKYGRELEGAPISLPSGWAALLCLYDLR